MEEDVERKGRVLRWVGARRVIAGCCRVAAGRGEPHGVTYCPYLTYKTPQHPRQSSDWHLSSSPFPLPAFPGRQLNEA